jgi:hypothetical protein
MDQRAQELHLENEAARATPRGLVFVAGAVGYGFGRILSGAGTGIPAGLFSAK